MNDRSGGIKLFPDLSHPTYACHTQLVFHWQSTLSMLLKLFSKQSDLFIKMEKEGIIPIRISEESPQHTIHCEHSGSSAMVSMGNSEMHRDWHCVTNDIYRSSSNIPLSLMSNDMVSDTCRNHRTVRTSNVSRYDWTDT